MPVTRLPITPILLLLSVSLIWGGNWAVTKLGAADFAPLFMAGLRSLIASACLAVFMKIRGIPFFPTPGLTFHGLVVGLMFGAEFGLIYFALAHYSLASHVYVLIYTAPIFAALGAHFFLEGDRLNGSKAAGLVVAFIGVVVLFFKDMAAFSIQTLAGDLMLVVAGAIWGATTIWIKRFMVYRSGPIQNLFYHLFFSMPLLLVLSAVFEEAPITGLSAFGLFSIFYQSIIVAFGSYLVWFILIQKYPASLIHAFSFFTPISGVFISGHLILGEPMTANLVASLALVILGMVMVNR